MYVRTTTSHHLKKMFRTKILKIEQTFIAPDRDIPFPIQA